MIVMHHRHPARIQPPALMNHPKMIQSIFNISLIEYSFCNWTADLFSFSMTSVFFGDLQDL